MRRFPSPFVDPEKGDARTADPEKGDARTADPEKGRARTAVPEESAAARPRWRRSVAATAAIGALVASLLAIGPVPAASAGTLALEITPIDTTDGSVITSIADGQHTNRITYEVQFSCEASACDDAQVQLSPSQPDPHGLLPVGRYLLMQTDFVPPVGGDPGAISGTDETGKTVTLGDLAAGESGNFRVTYAVPGDAYRGVPYGSFYPDGFEIEMAATLSSSTSDPITADASPVTWHVGLPPANQPSASISAPASILPGSVVAYNLPMNPGNMYIGGSNSGVRGDASYSATGNYTAVFHLPPEAELVGTPTQGGVYDAATHTVTWQQGTLDNPIYGARGGWGVNAVSGFNGSGVSTENPPGSTLADNYAFFLYRQVQLRFPAENFPDADANGCNFAADVQSSLDVTVNYLDGARTERSTTASRTVKVACWDPFVGVDTSKYVNGAAAFVNPAYMINVPAPGNPPTVANWYVRVDNRGNIPAVAVIEEPDLAQNDAEVYQIFPANIGATIEWELSDGTTGTTFRAHNQAITAPAGLHYTKATATTDPIPAGRIQPTDTGQTTVFVGFRFRATDTAPLGEQRNNTANVSVSYPGHSGPIDHYNGTEVDLPLTSTVNSAIQFSRPSPAIVASFAGAPVVGAPQLNPGTPVTYTARAQTGTIWPGTTIRPQYVFLAPVGWNVVPGSASVAGVAGVTYDYRTVTIGGTPRSVVVATWPTTITPSTTATEMWADLTVQATPTIAASTAPNAAMALIWAGDASGTLSESVGNRLYATTAGQFRAGASTAIDTGDVDQDDNRTEAFAQAGSGVLTVSGSSGLQVIKELCIEPDAAAPDGCATWTADTTTPHSVPANVDEVAYRVTVVNRGTTALNGVIAYDVLPHVGDATLTTTAAPRGSQFPLTIQSVTADPGVTMAYTASTNPTRPQVNPSATGTVDDWSADATGKVGARMTVGILPGGQARQAIIVAATDGSGAPDQRACNSVAVDSASTLPAEPAPVCFTLAEADLEIEVSSFENMQAGRPTTLGYTVTNHGGSAEAPATAEIEIPAGLAVTSLTPAGWSCATVGGDAAPVSGPATLSCSPVDDAGQPRLLAMDAPDELLIPAVVEDDDGELCTDAAVSGPLYDPEASNNSDDSCREIAPPPAGLALTKDDGQTATQIGAEYAYTITVDNTLLGETVEDAVVTDVLPASLEYVSSDPAATVDGQTLTWELDPLAPRGSAEVEVTVRVVGNAASPIVNEASVSAPDPGFPGETLTDSDEDANAVLALAVEKTSDARASGVREGDVVTYTVTVTGDDAGDYTGATITDDLTDVLDEATFVAGSATLSIDGATAHNVDDPTGGLLTWTGTIPAGATAVLTYQVTVGEPANGQLVNAVRTGSELGVCDAATGLDENGLACAVLSTSFAPTIAKTVEQLTQGDDGSWTIVYGIDVMNPAPAEAVYDLGDALAFSPGISVSSASVIAPDGVTAETWTGDGDLAVDAVLPGSATHHYTVTAIADAGTTAGTAAAVCTAGEALGFANTATLTLGDGTELDAEACAEPAKPAVTKELDGAPVQGDDGRWTIDYLIAVTNAAGQPGGGLAYQLEDSLDFPAGVTVDEVQVIAPDGVIANPGFTGGLAEIGGSAVDADAELVDGVARIPAAVDDEPTVHEYRVRVVAQAASVDRALAACGPEGAGYGNWVTLLAGSTELGRATACSDIRMPELEFTKTADTPEGTRPGDRITYTITATNVGDADFTPGSPAEVVDDMSDVLDDARYLGDATADAGTVISVSPTLVWTGPLAAGATVEIQYSVLIGEAGRGNGEIVNRVHLAVTEVPPGEVPACTDAPDADTECVVTLRVDTRILAITGAALPLGGLFAAALAAVAIGIWLARRRRLGVDDV